MYTNVGALEKTKGGRREDRKIENNNEVHYICVGTRHKDTKNC
jgi:hypothetical protein